MYKIAISKPILTLVFGLMLIFFGILALFRFPVALWPDIDFPVAMVMTTYPGANAEIVETEVTDKIEEALGGIDGMDKITSITSQGVSLVIASFKLEKPKEEAMSDLRDKVGSVNFDDPIIRNPIIQKFDSSSSPIISVFVSSDKVNDATLMKVAKQVIEPKLERISGVAGTNKIGYRSRTIRIYPDISLMNKYNITYSQLASIVGEENVEISGGKIRTDKKEWVVTTDAIAKSVDDLKQIRITNNVKLGDIAEVVDYISEDTTYASVNGKNGVVFEVQKIAGKNDIEIAQAVRDILPSLREQLKDFDIEILSDTTTYIQHSIDEVKFDLLLGAILATSIVFLFLRSFTMTIVAAISLPISIIGTFAFVQAMGQSLNMLVMLALTLAIGIIIDDAIVVIENIHKKLEKGMPRLEAAYEGVKEIGFAIIAISAMLLSVFVPIASMGEMIGRILQSFALTVTAAIIISYFVVITVIPMVSSLVVSTKVSRFYTITEPFFRGLDNIYVKMVKLVIRFKFITLLLVLIFFILSLLLVSRVGFNFMTPEDTGEFNIFVETSPGITLDYMKEKMSKIYDVVIEDKAIDSASVQIGYNSLQNAYRSKIYVHLVDQKDRKGRGQFAIMADLRAKLKQQFKDFTIAISEISTLGGGNNAPLQVIIKGDAQENVTKSANNLVSLLKQTKGITDVRTDTPDYAPEYRISILRQNANRNNISSQAIGAAVSSAFSGESKISYYRENSKEYDIVLRVPDKDRKTLEDLKYLQIPNADGKMIFVDGLIDIKETSLPASIKRYDRERSITIYGNIDQKQSDLNKILKEIELKKNEWLVNGTNYTLDGQAKYATDTLIQIGIAIATAFILIYLILAALYESLVQPIIIMITLPLSFSGAFIGLWVTGNSLSMFGLIGLMVLMGVVGKNATLIVDMANEFRAKGKDINEAIILAGESRLRPILMTVFAMVFGMIPLAISSGAGSAMKFPIGISMIGGLIVSMFLSLLAVPAFYKIMAPVDDVVRKIYAKNLKFK
ncbi:efflux RND transporter permease subunit [Helicobacter sp. MIT 14-3879]|uniref:efflux RND transporter permease subunit n=1 Tax=Helicobacter sp. MIT 14-3879 TaxID=2040649 RepID=UPI000E1E5701|nr:efflux RND transporter permease subunit [Helicobacter sp. MIT 14-3879]RDU64767.1 acriflavin resistance protein [Helicobacter sp. MIT 14-3879]